MTRICNTCKVEKDINEFYKEKRGRDGRRSQCKSCKESLTRDWRTRNREHLNAHAREYNKKHRLRNRLYKYNLTTEQFEQMLANQQGLCDICQKRTKDKTLVVDHCHKTDTTRALLCRKCNTLLSGLETTGWLDKALLYLAKYGV